MINSFARILKGRLCHCMVLLLESESNGVSNVSMHIFWSVKEFPRSTDDDMVGLRDVFPIAGCGEDKRGEDGEEGGSKSK